MVRKPKLLSSIRAKLFSAVAMLLVAVIMVVSSTYAWFTLSTAPEVTGMTTAIGANGALEMALRYSELDDDGKAVLKEGKADAPIREGILDENLDSNTYWGNLIAITDKDGNVNYGADKITLLPSALNYEGTTLKGAMLMTPTYGPDGRVQEVVGNTTSGLYNDTQKDFFDNEGFGFRAIGVSSGLTQRQLSYRNARNAAVDATKKAALAAKSALVDNGQVLATIALKKANDGESASFTQTEVNALESLLNGISSDENADGALDLIDQAYVQYVLMYVAGAAGGEDDAAWIAIDTLVSNGANIQAILAALTQNGVNVGGLEDKVEKLNVTKAAVATAKGKIPSGKETYGWDDIAPVMNALANMEYMQVNGIAAEEVNTEESKNALVSSIMAGAGLTVTMTSGAGVFVDIADHCGDYDAVVTIKNATVMGFTLPETQATMKADSSQDPSYLSVFSSAVEIGSTEYAGGGEELPLSEFYGYVIDMAFRTNATNSELLLQTEAADRIYGDNTNADTAGGGSTMTFDRSSINFTDDQLKALMGCIRVVFFTPGDTAYADGTILATAKLDMNDAKFTADGWSAPLRLYTTVTTTEYYSETTTSPEEGGEAETVKTTVYYERNGQYYDAATDTPLGAAPEDLSNYTKGTPVVQDVLVENTADATIQELTQNEVAYVSALVYLDGTNMTNAMVAFDAATSMTGKVNLQFSSSATLVPMDDGTLHQKAPSESVTANASGDVDVTTNNATSYVFKGSAPAGWTIDGSMVTVAADAKTGESAVIYAKNADGKVLKVWTVTVGSGS